MGHVLSLREIGLPALPCVAYSICLRVGEVGDHRRETRIQDRAPDGPDLRRQ
jgi:hypothetical protein